MNQLMFLRPDVLVEPLVQRWHAWPSLLSPLSAGLWARGRALPMLDTYLSDPEAQFRAAQAPAALGSWRPLVPPARAAELAALGSSMREAQAPLLALADQYRAATEGLARCHPGPSLAGAYSALGPALRGRVEFYSDLAHQPRLRVLEPLLRNERACLRALQSVVLRRLDERPRLPAFSTPRLPEPETLELAIPLDSPWLDRLAWARVRAVNPMDLADELSLSARDRSLFLSYFTDRPPNFEPHSGPGVRVRYFNHACVLLESRGSTVLTDPWLSYAPSGDADRLSIADLPERIDCAIITHAHADHLVLETLLALRPRLGTVVVPRASGGPADPSLRRLLLDLGFPRVTEVEELEQVPLGDGTITALPFLGEHGELPIHAKLTYRVELGGQSVFVGADAKSIDPETYRQAAVGSETTDLAFLGLECVGAPVTWLYEPFLERPLDPDAAQSRRLDGCDASEALALLEAIGAKSALVYAMGTEPWLRYISSTVYDEQARPMMEAARLIAALATQGKSGDRLHGSCEFYLEE